MYQWLELEDIISQSKSVIRILDNVIFYRRSLVSAVFEDVLEHFLLLNDIFLAFLGLAENKVLWVFFQTFLNKI